MSETNFETYRSMLVASLNSCGAGLTDETVLNLAYQVDGYLRAIKAEGLIDPNTGADEIVGYIEAIFQKGFDGSVFNASFFGNLLDFSKEFFSELRYIIEDTYDCPADLMSLRAAICQDQNLTPTMQVQLCDLAKSLARDMDCEKTHGGGAKLNEEFYSAFFARLNELQSILTHTAVSLSSIPAQRFLRQVDILCIGYESNVTNEISNLKDEDQVRRLSANQKIVGELSKILDHEKMSPNQKVTLFKEHFKASEPEFRMSKHPKCLQFLESIKEVFARFKSFFKGDSARACNKHVEFFSEVDEMISEFEQGTGLCAN